MSTLYNSEMTPSGTKQLKKGYSRTIRFRAWHESFKGMLEVQTMEFVNGKLECIGVKSKNATKDIKGIVLMQFLDIWDKDYKEIWEGDILRIDDTPFPINIVQWNIGGWALSKCGSIEDQFYHGLQDRLLKGRVIGNIFENKELLEGNE